MPEDIKNNPLRWDAAVRTESLSWSIIRQIREALFSGKLAPGNFLGSEVTLAQQFGVSRMAARDALRSLSAMGIVEIRMGSRGGAWVTTGNPERMVDAMAIQLRLIGVSSVELLEAQGAMSVVAAELAAGRATDEDVKRMRLAALATEDAGDDPQAFTTLSLRFHESVVEASQNRVLVAQFRALETVLGPLLVANTNPAVARRVIKSNTALLNAIVASDVEAAGRVMRERVVAIRAKLLGAVSAAANGSVPKPSSTAGGAAPRLAPK
jgi:GntR family transcriptional repressor for pyruvate dehydrogenase complex